MAFRDQLSSQKKVKFSDEEKNLVGKLHGGKKLTEGIKDEDEPDNRIGRSWGYGKEPSDSWYKKNDEIKRKNVEYLKKDTRKIQQSIKKEETDVTIEAEILEQELTRRDEVIRNIIGLCAENKPADVLRAFGEEITNRLRDIIADDKLEIKMNLLQPEVEKVVEEEDNDLVEAIEALLDLTEEELEALFESDEVSDEEKEAISSLILELMQEVGLEEGSFEDLKTAIQEKSSDGPYLSGSPEGTLGGKGPTPTKADGPKLGCGDDMKDTLKTKGSHPNPPVGPKSGPSAKHLKAGDLSNTFKK